jgi:hypothetical protein
MAVDVGAGSLRALAMLITSTPVMIRNRTILAALVVMTGSAQRAAAQAWVPDEGSLSISLNYDFSPSTAIVESVKEGSPPGTEAPELPFNITSHSIALGVEYVPIENLGLRLSVPLIGATLDPESARNPADPSMKLDDFLHGPCDDGSMCWSIQDARLDARYMIIDDPVAFSVLVGGSLPLANYPHLGSAGIGRGLKQLHLAAAAGVSFPFLPELYAHVRYEFSLVESTSTGIPTVDAHSQNKSDIGAQIGYFILPELEINVGMDLRFAHGGFNFVDWDFSDVKQTPEQDFHDMILRENFFLIGGGASYDITESLTVSLVTRFFISGTNTRNAHHFGGGLSYAF